MKTTAYIHLLQEKTVTLRGQGLLRSTTIPIYKECSLLSRTELPPSSHSSSKQRQQWGKQNFLLLVYLTTVAPHLAHSQSVISILMDVTVNKWGERRKTSTALRKQAEECQLMLVVFLRPRVWSSEPQRDPQTQIHRTDGYKLRHRKWSWQSCVTFLQPLVKPGYIVEKVDVWPKGYNQQDTHQAVP